MTRNNNISVLPFYESIGEQNHRLPYSFGQIYPLFTKAGYIIPFQIWESGLNTANLNFFLHDKNGIQIENISQGMRQSGLSISDGIIVYTGYLPVNPNIQEGQYYIRVTDGQKTLYSEIFTAVAQTDGFIEISWWDVEPLEFDSGKIIYGGPINYKNRLLLCTELSRPEYTFVEESEERDGFNFPLKQISEKTYKFTFHATEFLLDAMRFINLSDYVRVKDQYGRIYECDTFLFTPKWSNQGDIASVEVEFQTNTAVKKIGRGYIQPTEADFNDDFNNDYSIT